MSKQKHTPWFDANEKPVHPGVYLVRHSDRLYVYTFAYWSGSAWGSSSHTIQGAVSIWTAHGSTGSFQDKQWRGLAKKP